MNFEFANDTWVPTTGQGTVTASREEHFSHTGTRRTRGTVQTGDVDNGSTRTESRSVTTSQTTDLGYSRTDTYTWAPGSGSASGSGTGSGSASGSASTSPWKRIRIEESGNATATRGLSYDYSGSGSSWSTWGDFSMGGTHDESWDGVRSIRQQSTSSETLSRTITWNDQGQQLTTGSDARSASATGSADSLYHRQWEDHWWVYEETWASGGTYQNATYDDYNYQYRWTKTWQGQGDGAVSSSVSNHVTGLENGSDSGWRTHFVPEGSGGGTSSSSSWGGPWSNSYDETITYPGFYDYRYYGRDYGGGSGEEDYIAYVGDAFTVGSSPGASGGMFPFGYSDEETALRIRPGDKQSAYAYARGSHAAVLGSAEFALSESAGQTAGQSRAAISEGTDPPAPVPPGPRYFPYPAPNPIGYQGIGYMGDQIKRWEVDRANRVLDKMQAALRAATANLTPSQQADAMAELERLISTAIRHPSQMGRRRNDCGNWALEVIDKVGKTHYLKLRVAAWEYRKWQIGVGIPFTDWFLGHNAIEVTLPDGSVFYLDDGWWNHAFTPGDVPWYVTPWRP